MNPNDQDILDDHDRLLSQALADHDCDTAELGRLYLNAIGQREALHTAHVLADTVERHLLSHGYVVLNAEVFALVHKAVDALQEAYQKIGQIEHDTTGSEVK